MLTVTSIYLATKVIKIPLCKNIGRAIRTFQYCFSFDDNKYLFGRFMNCINYKSGVAQQIFADLH